MLFQISFLYYIFFNEEILKNLYIVPPNNLAFFKLSSEVIFLYLPSCHSKPAWLCSVEHKIRYFKNCLVTESWPTFFKIAFVFCRRKWYKSETTWVWVNHDQSRGDVLWIMTSVLVGRFLVQSCCILCFCYSVIFSGLYFRVNYSFKSAKELHVTSAWRASIELLCVIGRHIYIYIYIYIYSFIHSGDILGL